MITTTTTRATLVGNGLANTLSYPFKIFQASDLVVTSVTAGVTTTLALTTDYTLSGVGDSDGGTITLVSTPAVGTSVIANRVPALKQLTSIRNQGTYFASVHEDEFDKLTMQDQYLQAQLDDLNSEVTAGPVESFNGRTGVVVPVSGDYPASLIPFTQAGTGAVARTANDKFLESVSVKDYGAVGDGVADDTAAIQAAINANAGRRIKFPAGTYNVTSLTPISGMHLEGEGAYRTKIVGTTSANIISASDGLSDISLYGIYFYGAQLGTGDANGGAFYLTCATADASNISITYCRFSNFKGGSVVRVAGNGTLTDAATNFASNVWIKNNQFDANYDQSPTSIGTAADAISVQYGVNDFVIADNAIDANYQKIGIKVFTGSNRGSVYGNSIKNCGIGNAGALGAYGILVYSYDTGADTNKQIKVFGNSIYNTTKMGIYIHSGYGVEVYGNDLVNCDLTPDDTTLPSGAIAVGQTDNTLSGPVLISNNYVEGAGLVGIQIANAKQGEFVRATANIVRNCPQGIRGRLRTQNAEIEGNTIYNCPKAIQTPSQACRTYVTDGAITSGDNTLTSASGPFLATDVGTAVNVAGAGAAGVSMYATISTYNSATSVSLSGNASTTVTGATTTVGSANYRIANNHIYNATSYGISTDAFGVSTSLVSGIVIKDNFIQSTPTGIAWDAFTDSVVENNTLTGITTTGISGKVHKVSVKGNHLSGVSATTGISLTAPQTSLSASPSAVYARNEADGFTTAFAFPSSLAVVFGGGNTSSTSSRYEILGTSAPGSGTWRVGDTVWNTGAAAGGSAGWYCTAAGSPGTWVSFGALGMASGSSPWASPGPIGATTPNSGIFNILYVNAAAGTTRDIAFESSGSLRWIIRANNATESGSDVGSDLNIIARTDAGATIDTAFSIARKAGGFMVTTRPFAAKYVCSVPQGTTSGTVDYTGATDSSAHLQAIIAATAQGTPVWLGPGTTKYNTTTNVNGVVLKGSGTAQLTSGATSYWQPFDVTKPVVQISDDAANYNGSGVEDALLYTPSGTGHKGLVFAGGSAKNYAKNIYSLGFTTSCIEFRNDDVNPCTFNTVENVVASTNVAGAYGIAFIDPHASGGTGWTTANQVCNFSTTAPNGYPVYCEGAQTNSLSNGYIQTSYSGHGLYFKMTSTELYTPRLNFSNVDVDNVSGYGGVSVIFDYAPGTYGSNYRSASNVANLTPITGELNSAGNSYWITDHTTLSADFTVGATTITLTSVTGMEAGMHIMIPGAGTSGRNYFDQIVSINTGTKVVALSQHNSATQVNSGGDVSYGNIVNAIATRGPVGSFSNRAIAIGASNKIGVTGDGAGLLYQSNANGTGPWASADYFLEMKDKQFRIYESVSSPTVSAISRVGTTVTVTTSSAHKMGVGDVFSLTGITDKDGYNSTTQWQPVVASVPSTTTFTYTSLVSSSDTPSTIPTLVPYLDISFNRGALTLANGANSGVWLKAASGTAKVVLYQDNTTAQTYFWTPDTTNGVFDIRYGSSVGASTTKAVRIGTNSVGDYAYFQGNGVMWVKNAAAPSTDAGGCFFYADTADGKPHVKDNAGNNGAILHTANSVLTSTSAAPTGTTSATAVMMGLGGSAAITTKTSTRILITACFQAANSTINDGITCDLRYGTGTAPVNGAAVTGTLVGIAQTRTSLVAADRGGMTLTGIVTGLTVGTAYWIDVSALAVTAGTASITGVTITAHEI